MENRKGSGIFLGVVSVATLIVAIIGATFAYFSASITGDNNVNVTAYEFNASLSVSPVYPTSATTIIPLNPNGAVTGEGVTNTTNLLYAMNEAANRCVDSNGYQVCTVYSATFKNNGSQKITLNGTLTTTKNEASKRDGATGFTNLKFGNLTGTKETNNFALDGEVVAIKSATVDNAETLEVKENSVEIGSVEVNAGETVTKYFVVYLDEQADANNPEMGASFEGQLTYTSATGGQQLTGTFNVSGS